MFSSYKTLFFLFLCFAAVHGFRRQSAAVRGKLRCGSEPASNVLVKLFDQDDGPDPDDLLDSKYTDADGSFYLAGDTMELTNIDPEVRIYHSCNQHLPLCKREWVIEIPDKYITSGQTPNKVIDLGELNLETIGILLALALAVSGSIIPEQHTGIQSYKVRGKLLCGSEPAANVRVKLVDDDFGPDPDDDLDSGYTDMRLDITNELLSRSQILFSGNFELAGDTTELTTIDVHLKIYHDCNDALIPCQRRWKFELPNKYITSGKLPQKTLDIGTWNLEAKMPKEGHDCIH
ncbi:hypothetical protein M3Y97_00559800 [Aphelenchoides bicaudatus]|nr:hypothetical protein M3Y97_00559800 [Aphelenchoides bicaudatus]